MRKVLVIGPGGAGKTTFARALDTPRLLSLWRAVQRTVGYRGRSRPDLPEGCPERLTWEFVWWIRTYKKRRRPGMLRQLATLPSGTRAVVLRSSREAREFLDRLE